MQNILENIDNCTGCSSCAQSCVQQCIQMTPNEEGFLVPRIDNSRCTDCRLCQKACPVLKAHKKAEEQNNGPTDAKPRVYAAWSQDDATRLNSSSGGIFSLLAEACLQKGGTVFGASFDSDFTVKHTGISNTSELDNLRRSKYVQSDIHGSYAEAENLLEIGKPVLFSGTGCQIAGLKSYLGKNYPGLLTVDLVCYGVPSPGVWSLYLDYITRKFKSGIKAVSFRNKQNGWEKYRMRIEFKNGRVYSRPAVDETYFIGFGKGLFNRKSCSTCMFRHPNSKADITLADFWGITKLPGNDARDNKGVSQIIVNTSEGQDAFDALAENCRLQERSFEEAARLNPRLVSSCPLPESRARFFYDYTNGTPFAGLMRKYMNPSVQRVKRIVKTLIGRVN